MKIRNDYVTNSSSSSFIISRDDISIKNLLKLLIELANETAWWDKDNKHKFTAKDFRYDTDDKCIYISNFYLRAATEDRPYNSYDEWCCWYKNEGEGITYTNHYIIDNDTCVRYDWSIIEKILSKYNLDLVFGYCD